MNDFDETTDVRGDESLRECPACGLLPREHYRPDATLEARESVDERPTGRLYHAVQVAVGDAETTLLVGSWCELERDRAYRIEKSGPDATVRGLVAVELDERDAETGRYRFP